MRMRSMPDDPLVEGVREATPVALSGSGGGGDDGALSLLLHKLTELVQPEPARWTEAIHASLLFKASSFTYSWLGATLLLMVPTLEKYGPYPTFWRFMGAYGVLSRLSWRCCRCAHLTRPPLLPYPVITCTRHAQHFR